MEETEKKLMAAENIIKKLEGNLQNLESIKMMLNGTVDFIGTHVRGYMEGHALSSSISERESTSTSYPFTNEQDSSPIEVASYTEIIADSSIDDQGRPTSGDENVNLPTSEPRVKKRRHGTRYPNWKTRITAYSENKRLDNCISTMNLEEFVVHTRNHCAIQLNPDGYLFVKCLHGHPTQYIGGKRQISCGWKSCIVSSNAKGYEVHMKHYIKIARVEFKCKICSQPIKTDLSIYSSSIIEDAKKHFQIEHPQVSCDDDDKLYLGD